MQMNCRLHDKDFSNHFDSLWRIHMFVLPFERKTNEYRLSENN